MSLLSETLQSLIRHGLVLLFGFLVLPLMTHGWLTSGTGAKIESSLNNWAALVSGTLITFFAPLLWSYWSKVVAKARVIMAIHSPVHATPETVAAKVSLLSAPQKLATAVTEQAPLTTP